MSQHDVARQASGLASFRRPRPVRVIAVASGKGGVGKTNVSVNLGVAFAAMGRRTMLLDADLGLANVDVLLGLQARYNLSHLLSGERELEEIMVSGPGGLRIVPASSGVARLADLASAELNGIIGAFSSLSEEVDVLIVDTAAGISPSVLQFCVAAQEVMLVVCDEPSSLTDAYALVKVLARDHAVRRFHTITNRVDSVQHGRKLHNKLQTVCDRFLDVPLQHMGTIPEDPLLRRAVQMQSPVVTAYPSSPASRAFKELAARADKLPEPRGMSGCIEFFLERLAGAHSRGDGLEAVG
ncbi:MinD/ParA family protein [Wenzhouxiangella sp. XN24]|uniref:MinD/ParA family protein n=1 Tax=Wenzhouxiangella sp. XN24 TaxID=2713569 RepID=UPI0013EA9D83|nr:MinD/ParA family protein [Wenzhouxiangella sp. XN24]NGX16245.1 MinD/ParA family protein [Wenzhouxiangella sp. XN24]